MKDQLSTTDFSLKPEDNQRLASLCGQLDENLRLLEERLGVEIHTRGNAFHIQGSEEAVKRASHIIKTLYSDTKNTPEISQTDFHLMLKESEKPRTARSHTDEPLQVSNKHGRIKARSENQKTYLKNIHQHDINFGIGPAGTGKTYLAVACAIEALQQNRVQKLVLTRPAVEAGEHLGFLPGDLTQKIDPYCRPLYDALYEMLGQEVVVKYIEREIIEVAPLAYMRGRTLNDAFIILDEGQNTTIEQMKMFLTRMGFNSKVIVTGDITQIDLPRGVPSGLRDAVECLQSVDGIGITHLQPEDVIRHTLVQKIINAYNQHTKNNQT